MALIRKKKMDSNFSEDQIAIRDAIQKLCADFDDDYWLRMDKEGGPAQEFIDAVAAAGWLGIAMPEEYGGSGLGMTEAALMMQTIAASGGAIAACSSVHLNIFGPNPVVVFGSEEQKTRMLPPLIRGEESTCFAVTEPNSGLDTSSIETRAELQGDRYIVNGQKVFTTNAQNADKILLLTRTTPKDQVTKPTDGLTLFFTDLDRDHVEIREIDKMGRKAVDTNALFVDDLPIPVEDRIGEEGKGFQCLLHGLNPERIIGAAVGVGVGRQALKRAVDYAKERVVFGRPIGQNQAIQHPLADSWAQLEAANLMTFKAAQLYDSGQSCGAEANAAKYLSAEAAFTACERAVMTHGGMGYAKEYHVERYLREIFILRIAPVSREMILNFIAERVLGLPRSY